MQDTVKYVLDESRLPRRWYNIMADLPSPPPAVMNPGTNLYVVWVFIRARSSRSGRTTSRRFSRWRSSRRK
jgi:hypothetical protein